jgi:IMP dehydrogenase
VVGILTARDVKFLTDYSVNVEDVMTRDPIVGGPDTTMTEAFDTMLRHRIGKLPIVDAERRLLGLYSFHDVRTLMENMEPQFNRDAQHQLRVAAAVGPHDEERIEALVRAGVDALVIDTAHGHSKGVIDTLRMLKREHADVDVVAGNVGTGEGARALMDAGADAVKVGIGPGSICTTRIVAGVGIPQLTAIYEASRAVEGHIPVVADGGIAYSGDVPKALAVGACCVMMGSALAGTEECPGERILHQGRTYVIYRGMGSLDAMKAGRGSRERYSQGDVEDTEKLVPQGIEGMIPYRGPVEDVLHQYAGGLRFALGYCGVRTVPDLQQRARLFKVSAAGRHESHPHDVKVVKDAPNYRAT